ncbi:MAG: twin-arginine translocase subunit TatC [Actinomycetota bacterium]
MSPIFVRRRGGTRRDPEGAMTLVEHLEELRTRLIRSLGAVALGGVVGWFLYDPVLDLLLKPYCDYLTTVPESIRPRQGCGLFFMGALDPVLIKLKLVAFIGFFLALPFILFQIWRFVVPGLTKSERRMGLPFILSSVILFALGALVAYVTLPRGLAFLLGFAGPQFAPLLTGDRFLGFVMMIALAFGLSFEFPVVLVLLQTLGVVSPAQLAAQRRAAVLFVAVFAAIITPSSDPYSMLALMLPMLVFYEAAIVIGRLLRRRAAPA